MNKKQLIKESAWVFGPIASALIPSLASPLEPEVFPFLWAGCVAMLIGFLAERWRENDKFLMGIPKSRIFVVAASGFLIFGTVYNVLLGQINSPTRLQEGLWFLCFVVSGLCGGYLVSLAHRHGASFLIEKYT